jgi:imidazolonepropionase-like amidohydrolase
MNIFSYQILELRRRVLRGFMRLFGLALSRKKITNFSVFIWIAFTLPAQSDVLAAFNSQETSSLPIGRTFAIEHINIIPMTTADAFLRDVTVVVENMRISSITPSDQVILTADIIRIDGTDKWLMPSLTDMHVHVENERLMELILGRDNIPSGTIDAADIFLPYVAQGVLQILNLGAMSEAIGQRDAIESGRVLGPHMALAAMIDGGKPIWPIGFTRSAATPADGRQAVRDVQAEGYDFIKVYSQLDRLTFNAIIDEAQKHGIRVIGHIPGKRTNMTEKYIRPGFDLVAHAEEFAYQASTIAQSEENINRYVELAKKNNTWLISTLTLNERIAEQMDDISSLARRPELRTLHPLTQNMWLNHNGYANSSPERAAMVDAVVKFNRKLVKAFNDAGIPVIPGSDSVVHGVAPGFSLHDEFEALARAGIPNKDILFADTHLAAQWLGVLTDRGTIEVGKRANLIMLDANPLVNISNTRKIAAVISSGRYYSSAQLDQMMEKLAKRYEAMLK